MGNTLWYGQWGQALIIIAVFGWLIFRFLRPRRKREWRNGGILGAFIIALYAEMYGFPLTIYVFSSVFGIDIPLTHFEGHLWSSLLGLGEAGAMAEMLFGYAVMAAGGLLVIAGWRKVYEARGKLVTNGIYQYFRHPQYTGIILVTFGMLIHWPTLITLLMWPILISAYYGLAKREEKEAEKEFGEAWDNYAQQTPAFIPWRKMQAPQ